MAETMEVQVARIDERVLNIDKKVDAIADNQKEMAKAVEEFHVFKRQVLVWGSVGLLIFGLFKDALLKLFGM